MRTFLAEVRREMKDISWPDWREVRFTTITVLFFIFVVATYVYVVDRICLRLIDQMLLRQRLNPEAQFYCFLFHKSQKSFTVAGPCPAKWLLAKANNFRSFLFITISLRRSTQFFMSLVRSMMVLSHVVVCFSIRLRSPSQRT